MAIGRAEDRDTPRNPAALRRRVHVRDPIRATHLGQRSSRPHSKAGHMTAIDQNQLTADTLHNGGRPHMGPVCWVCGRVERAGDRWVPDPERSQLGPIPARVPPTHPEQLTEAAATDLAAQEQAR
jgi:hypothetical protein